MTPFTNNDKTFDKKVEEKELKELLLAGLNSDVSEKTTEEVFSDLRNYIKFKS